MEANDCSRCGAARVPGRVTCVYCNQPYSAEAAKGAIGCPKCKTLSAADQPKCVGCGEWIVVSCLFCGQLSPYTAAACVSCGEVFLGAAERKAAQAAGGGAADDDDDWDWEEGWAWCGKCQALVFDSDPGGACPAGGVHATEDSEAYYLCADEDYGGEAGWRWCGTCQALYHHDTSQGVCSATRGPHAGDATYTIDRDDAEGGWKWCKRCSVLFWNDEPGTCAAGGKHDASGAAAYDIATDDEE